MSGTGTVEPTPTVEVEYKIINPTPTQLQELAEVASGGTITVGGGGASGSGSGGGTTSAPVRTGTYTVATLPTGQAAGSRAYVTDATAPTFLGTLTGGGTVGCPVVYNGTAWVAG